MLPILVNERDFESTVIKKANQFISFKFGDIQLLEILNYHDGATSLDSFLKAYKTSETERIFLYHWFGHPVKMQSTKLPLYHAFYSEFCGCNPREAEYNDFVILLKFEMTTEQDVSSRKYQSHDLQKLKTVHTSNNYGSSDK